MNAKKLMGMIACAGACVSLSAFANTTNGWFGVTVANNDMVTHSCSTNGAAVSIEAGKIVIDNELESALAIVPGAGNDALSDGLVTITSTAVLTPSDKTDLKAPITDAQAGFAVAVDGNVTNFYGYASAAGEENAPAWVKLSGTPNDPEVNTTFTIAINYRDKTVSFYKGDALLTDATDNTTSAFAISSDNNKLNNIAAYGSGSITSVTSKYEVAVAAATVNNVTKKYGSGAEAVKAAGASGTVLDIDPTTGNPAQGPQADNGLYVWQCDILGIEENATIPLQPATKEVASDKIAVAVSGYTPIDGVSVKFGVKKDGGEATGSYDADAIGIPLETGTYTIVPNITAE